jgi:hypothetical protein
MLVTFDGQLNVLPKLKTAGLYLILSDIEPTLLKLATFTEIVIESPTVQAVKELILMVVVCELAFPAKIRNNRIVANCKILFIMVFILVNFKGIKVQKNKIVLPFLMFW